MKISKDYNRLGKQFTPCTKTLSWKKLQAHARKIKKIHLRDLFEEKSGSQRNAIKRFQNFSLEYNSVFLDYSKNKLDRETLNLLIELTQEMHLEQMRNNLFSGTPINWTEDRSVLHTLLRDLNKKKFFFQGKNLMPEIHGVITRMERFSEKVRKGSWKGKSQKPITDVVNIGIGGSYLGPKMAVRALHRFGDGPKIHFVSNVDGNDIDYILQDLTPETTLFLIASKTFTTEETLSNAQIAKKWIISKLGDNAVAYHFACMSTNETAVREFGINPDNMFEFWDFVGGRYSIWSAIGLPLMISIGHQHFKEFLHGAHQIDRHFYNAPPEKNLPILLALIGIWHNNFLKSDDHLVIPYSSDLSYFTPYLQQMVMESNGKQIDRRGLKVSHRTGNTLWGGVGTDSQHSFFQLLHQGTKSLTADFIGIAQHTHPYPDSHERLLANLFAQTESLAFGLNTEETKEILYQERSISQKDLSRKQFLTQKQIKNILPHRVFPGDRSTNTLLINSLTPENLGKLIAIYEHKVFVQGIIWGINSYDQWGVELGKRATKGIVNIIRNRKPLTPTSVGVKKPHPSTKAFVKKYHNLKKKNQ